MVALCAEQVGHQRHDGYAAPRGIIDSGDHRWLLAGNNDGAIAIMGFKRVQGLGQRVAIECLDAAGADMHALGQGGSGAAGHGLGEAGHEFIGAIGNEEAQAQIARSCQQRGRQITLKADFGDGSLDLFSRDGADAGSAIENPIHGGEGYAGSAGHVMDGGAAFQPDLVHACSLNCLAGALAVITKRSSATLQLSAKAG